MKVEVLVALFNGAQYIPEFVKSLSAQSCTDFEVLISDDGSEDRSKEIFIGECQRYSIPCSDVSPEVAFGSSKSNFEHLIGCSSGTYVMLADQDDYWKEEKILLEVSAIIDLEEKVGRQYPCMVFSDLEIVDSQLNFIGHSMMSWAKLDPGWVHRPEYICCQNPVAGCTLVLNRAAVGCVLPFTKASVVHDHWIAMAVVQHGYAAYVDVPTILYRQHDGNQIGARNFSPVLALKKITSVLAVVGSYAEAARDAGIKISFCRLLWIKAKLNIFRLFIVRR